MQAGRASRTAHLVAMGRAFAHAGMSRVENFQDPTARAFLSDKGRKSLDQYTDPARAPKPGLRTRMAMSLADSMALRTSAIDAAVLEAIAGGARQLVILGAGFDGRAWRLQLGDTRVFEVDHPATQADKRARAASLSAPARALTFVPVDFERDSLDSALERAGHDASLLTCWIWEGVVMYLTREAMHATLDHIARRSARGSTLIINYHAPHGGFFSKLILRLIGEPQINASAPAEMSRDLESAGFRVHDDTGLQDWNRRFARGEADDRRLWYMRIAIAKKR